MPVYLFRCSTCGENFERWRPERRRDDPLTCPRGHASVARLPGLKPRDGDGPAPLNRPPQIGPAT